MAGEMRYTLEDMQPSSPATTSVQDILDADQEKMAPYTLQAVSKILSSGSAESLGDDTFVIFLGEAGKSAGGAEIRRLAGLGSSVPPVWTPSGLLEKSAATQSVGYSDTIDNSELTDADGAVDLDVPFTHEISKVDGPAWLTLVQDGTGVHLGGTPGAGDVGTNEFTIRADDLDSNWANALLRIEVS